MPQRVQAEGDVVMQAPSMDNRGYEISEHTFLARRIRPSRCASCRLDPAWELIWMSTLASGMSMELSPTLDRNTVLTCSHASCSARICTALWQASRQHFRGVKNCEQLHCHLEPQPVHMRHHLSSLRQGVASRDAITQLLVEASSDSFRVHSGQRG